MLELIVSEWGFLELVLVDSVDFLAWLELWIEAAFVVVVIDLTHISFMRYGSVVMQDVRFR